jgi:hypothetical protein
MKDVNLQKHLLQNPNLINLDFDSRMSLIRQLKIDTKFFADRNIMDYSMLLVIEEKNNESIALSRKT